MNKTKLYFRMLAYLRPYIPTFFLSLLLSLMSVGFEGSTYWIMPTVAQTLFSPSSPAAGPKVDLPSIPIGSANSSLGNLNKKLNDWVHTLIQADTPIHTLERVCFIFLLAYLLKNIFGYINALIMTSINVNVVRDLRNTLYKHSLMLPVTYYDRNRSGEIISKILNDVGAVNSAMTNTFSQMITQPVRLIVFWGGLFIINFKMTLLVLLIYPALIYIIVNIGKSVRRRSRRMLESMAGLMAILHETVMGVRAVKMFNMNEVETTKFTTENQRFSRRIFSSVQIGALTGPLTEIFGLLLAIGLIWYGGNQVLSGKGMTAEDFIRYITLLLFSYQPIKAIGGINNAIQGGLAAAQRVFETLDSPPEPLVSFNPASIPSFAREIKLEHVRFTYPGTSDEVIKDISFSIKKGQIVALVGSSGCGKSTLLDLVPRFYDINAGKILIDGRDTRECDLVGLRHLFGIVAQNTFLFNDTVFNNIGYGIETATKDDVMRAAQAANAWEFIEKLPKGLDTLIGENGIMLSGGQCQRLSIARALLRNPPILILDEATSSLDTESERLVQHAINNLITNRTALVVAHRLSTIQHADQILVIEQGTIVEQGTHQELLQFDSRYKYFHTIQFNEASAAA